MNKTYFEVSGQKLKIKRLFDAPLPLVWEAWTNSKLLDQWWAPEPWKSETKFMNFKPGGYRLYAMVGPDGTTHWSRMDYDDIIIHQEFSGQDSFCDEQGISNPQLPSSQFVNRFVDFEDHTKIISDFIYESEEAIEMVLKMGMKEGLEAACENLDKLLTKLHKV